MINGLPDRLKALRLKYHYSQKQVADLLNMSPSIVSGYETGERTPSVEVLLSFSYLYNVPPIIFWVKKLPFQRWFLIPPALMINRYRHYRP